MMFCCVTLHMHLSFRCEHAAPPLLTAPPSTPVTSQMILVGQRPSPLPPLTPQPLLLAIRTETMISSHHYLQHISTAVCTGHLSAPVHPSRMVSIAVSTASAPLQLSSLTLAVSEQAVSLSRWLI